MEESQAKTEESQKNGTLKISVPTVLSAKTDECDPLLPKLIPSSDSKLSLPSNLVTPTSPLRLSSPLSLPTSPTPFIKVMSSQPPLSPKTLAKPRKTSLTSSTEETMRVQAPKNFVSTGSATGNPRNKCALQPGHSLMDWIRLGNSGKDLSGVGGRLRPVAPRELAEHNAPNDAWLAIRGRVYNITHYLPFHPGGPDELMKGAGTDATQLFDKVHAWVNYDSLLAKCLIGPLSVDRPDAEEVFGFNTSPKHDRLKEPSKAQELVRKSMENLANCITPARKKITSKPDDKTSSNPSKIMQSLIQSSDLPVSISRRAAASSEKSKNDDPPPLRHDWIQTSTKLTIYIYTGALANPSCCARLTEGALVVEIATNGWVRILKVIPEAKLVGPLQLQVYAESGKVEVIAQKDDPCIWKGSGDISASPASQMSTPRFMMCRVAKSESLTHDTVMLALSAEAGAVVVPLGHHIRIHCKVNGSEVVRSYTPVGEGWDINEDRSNTRYMKFAIKRYDSGALSSHLSGLRVDDVVTLSGPYGDFQLQVLKNVTTAFFIAAGTGITPMLGLIRFMLSRSNPRCDRVSLVFFNKKEEDILYRTQFDNITKVEDRFTVTHVLSDPSPSWSGYTGRISLDKLSNILDKEKICCSDHCTHFASACGPTEFTQLAIEILIKLGMKDECVHAFMG